MLSGIKSSMDNDAIEEQEDDLVEDIDEQLEGTRMDDADPRLIA